MHQIFGGLSDNPVNFSDEVFDQAFQKAELARLGQAERESYGDSLKIYRDLKGVVDTSSDEGVLKGQLEGKLEIAVALKKIVSFFGNYYLSDRNGNSETLNQ